MGPSRLTFGAEVVILVKIQLLSPRMYGCEVEANEELRRKELVLLPEDKK